MIAVSIFVATELVIDFKAGWRIRVDTEEVGCVLDILGCMKQQAKT